MRSRTGMLAGFLALGLVAAVGAFFVLRPRDTQTSDRAVYSDPQLLEAKLVEAGLTPDLAKRFSTVTTEVISSSSDYVHVVHEIPGSGLRQDVQVVIRPDQQVDVTGMPATPNSAGATLFVIHHSIRLLPNGLQRYVVAFIPYDSIDPEALQRLGLQRRARTLSTGSAHPVALRSTQMSLGIIVASVSGTAGGDTFVNPGNPGNGLTSPEGAVVPSDNAAGGTADTAAGQGQRGSPRVDTDLSETRGRGELSTIHEGPVTWTDGSPGPTPEEVRTHIDDWRSRMSRGEFEREFLTPEQVATMERNQAAFREGMNRRVGNQLAEEGQQFRQGLTACRGSAPTVASQAIPKLLQAGGDLLIVNEAVNQYAATSADSRSGNEQIDAYERAFRGETGNATQDSLAQRALTEDPRGTQITSERIAAARLELAINNGLRYTNTTVGNGGALVTSAINPVASAIMGLTTMLGDAALRDAHSSILTGLEVSESRLTERAREVIANSQRPDVTNTLGDTPGQNVVPRVDGGCDDPINADPGAGQALVVIRMTEDDGRTISFRSIVNLVQTFSVYPEFRGQAIGPYREEFTSEQCGGFTVSWTSQATVNLVARFENLEFEAIIEGPATQNGEYPDNPPTCPLNSYYVPYDEHPAKVGTTCRWDNIPNFVQPRIFESEPPGEGCTLIFGGGLYWK